MKADYLEESLLRELEERLLQPDVRKSAKDIMDLLADEFIEFGSSGRVFNKQQIIESLQNEPIQPPGRPHHVNKRIVFSISSQIVALIVAY
ncbi:DUF4440 domain-containing protein [uncultured Nostoc sp.]|uniref:DUF4440 domain-containing protein n=1 Tax=uncultured Nostoc sp. TaxID=340711 RepID=UPI0035CA239B